MRTLLALFVLALLTGCESEPPLLAADKPTAVTLPMQLDGVHASIEVTVNGQSARMLLDTGADQIVLTPAAAERFGLQLSPVPIPGSGAGGQYTAFVTRIAELAVGAIQGRKLTAYVVPFPAEFHYDGVLGTPFFATLLTTLDYQERTVTFRSGASFDPPPGATQIPIRLESGKLLVMASAAGVTGWFSVDTGAGNALTFFTPTVKQYGLHDAFSPSVRAITGVSPGGYTRGTLVRVPDVTIGPHVLHQVVVELSEANQGLFATSLFSGNLGGELWRRFEVTLDYPGRQMSLTPNDALAEPFDGPRSGLVPSLADGAIRVVDVMDASPASDAGVRVGDAIVALNGASTEAQGETARAALDTVSQALRAAPGTQVRLTLRDGSGAEREVTLPLRDLL